MNLFSRDKVISGMCGVTVVHSLPGRVRLYVQGLKGNRKLAGDLMHRLVQLSDVRLAQANPLTGRVLVVFDSSKLPVGSIVKTVALNFNKKLESGVGGGAVERRVPVEKDIQEPEDLPIRKQLFNVALGGGVLAFMGLKLLLKGRTPLANHPYIFGLAAATTLISGYPVFRSGLEGLSKGRINYDLVMGALALGTILARESIPGLMVIWLTNLTALSQSLVLKGYRNTLPDLPELAGEPVRRTEEKETPTWHEAGEEYGRKMVLPVLGLASLSGLTGGAGGFQRTLAMLLAANPCPVGLAAPTAATAAMVMAGRNGIYFRNTGTLEAVAKVDTIVFDGPGALPGACYQVGDALPMPGISKAKLLALAAQASNKTDSFAEKVLEQALAAKKQRPGSWEGCREETGRVLVGEEKDLAAAGVETKWGVYKARRLQHLAQIPVYVSWQGRLAGLIGIKRSNAGDLRRLTGGLRALGIRNCLLVVEVDHDTVSGAARELGLQPVIPDRQMGACGLVKEMKLQGHRVAVVVGNEYESRLLKEADVGICSVSSLKCDCADVVVSNYVLLPEVFSVALRGEQRARQNLALVQAANATGLVLGATGRLPPMLAKVYNNLISVAVGANSLRLLRRNKNRAARAGPAGAEREIAATMEHACSKPAFNPVGDYHRAHEHDWHALTVDEAMGRLRACLEKGLSSREAQHRLGLYGPNKMQEEKRKGFITRLREQFKDALVKTLVVSALVCILMGELGDALAIIAILTVNAALGVVQEQKADGSLQALSDMTAPTAKVRRSGKVERIPAVNMVPCDIVLLEQGDGVPADLRILEANTLEIEESVLTGESHPVLKNTEQMTACLPLLDCRNLAFMGTNVSRGRGAGLVVATGMATEVGKIAGMMDNTERVLTPLQTRMADAGGVILKYCLAASALVVLAGVLRGGSLFKMFLSGVSLAVAAIPEGLPAVVTIALASGVSRMARENAVVRSLAAVETLGSTTLICTDKTGTLTQNRQLLRAVYTGSGWWQARPGGPLKPVEKGCDPKDLVSLLSAGILCTDANLKWSPSKRVKSGRPQWEVEGDPTEGALLLAGLEEELNYQDIRQKWQRVRELPFDAERLRMTVVCRDEHNDCMAFVKGAPEVVINLCTHIRQNDEDIPMDSVMRSKMLVANKRLSGDAMRVLAIAYRPVDDPEQLNPEESLTLLGLTGMIDPLRPEAGRAIEACRRAGIKVVMVTGDHPCTALAVAKKVGLARHGRVLTGQEMEQLSDLELAAAVSKVRVFARVLPAQKLRLVKAFQSRGEIVAVIGDGINDAPAVKEGDIGVAMGGSGTDVTRKAADIILTDDNFATLVAAVEQGRGIYCNIRRSVRYLLSTNVGLVLMVLSSVLMGLPMPLLPIQLLFLNVLGDGLPALALGVEPPGAKLMGQPPRPAGQSLFADGLGPQIISRGLATGLVGLAAYRRLYRQDNLERARTVGMTTFAASKLMFALACADRQDGRYSRHLTGAVALSAALLVGAVYLPAGNRVLKTVPLGFRDIGTVLGASGLTYLLEKGLSTLVLPDQAKHRHSKKQENRPE